ncbi:N-terminal double-transmembrane domain-containing protein [Arboricoccus pini]|uniref:N-terminal double-transmembrane domain-containing protein n=1 Tax=Arboricoccus pini TaxID=1963835 RepID=A0A212R0A5_9PROT|nr:DUF4159 domain-containing protein [Arboricoccus pini]SNB65428.1 N-terminal double-transmembrane domain-containing protein [Arboricoccus pini]
MLSLGVIAFAHVWVLLALLALPVIWLLLRATPPSPKQQSFPALRLLLRLDNEEETPARTPWWLLLLRLAVALLIVLAIANPIINPTAELNGNGPLLLVVDDGFVTAADWPARKEQIKRFATQAQREGREVMVLRTAPDPQGNVRLESLPVDRLLEEIDGWMPQPWAVDRAAAVTALADLKAPVTSVWIGDAIATSRASEKDAANLAHRISALGPARFLGDSAAMPPLLYPPDSSSSDLKVVAKRPLPGPADERQIRAIGPDGEVLAHAALHFAEGDKLGSAIFDLPVDLKNRIAQLELQPRLNAGGVVLLDERWRRRTVGIVGNANDTADQPLLSEDYFLERAFKPFAAVRTASIEELTSAPLSLIVLPDTGQLADEPLQKLSKFVDDGGVVLRFAGPRFAAGHDNFVPVALRGGDRQLGGALSWSQPLAITQFNPQGPFAGLIPNPEATVNRQVLAEPGPNLAAASFASLSDGTPLITGKRMGKGWLLLVHTTANTSWTSLPLSGLFVDILRRTLVLAPGAGGMPTGSLHPSAVLDGFGNLRPSPAGLAPISSADFPKAIAGPQHPPGLYAPTSVDASEDQIARSALNVQTGAVDYIALQPELLGGPLETFSLPSEFGLGPWLLLLAFLLGLADMVIGLALRGLGLRLGRATALGIAACVLLLGSQSTSFAQSDNQPPSKAMKATLETQLAYVLTGNQSVDDMSRAGLEGLGQVLGMRTSIEPADPAAIDLATDDLAVYPFIYWPMPPSFPDLNDAERQRIEAYLRQGGMILFDTQDAGDLLPGQNGGGPGEQRLAQVLRGLDIPPLMQVPPDHVLTRSFYLLQDFPGRWTGQPVWVDQVPTSLNDGVSSVIIGANDWAGAWAVDEFGNSLLPVVPGGEEQREMARRFGVNAVMYALTGNYKTDQVHVPALLERLGQ